MPVRWSHRFEHKPDRWVFIPTEETLNRGHLICRTLKKHWTPPYFYYHLQSGGHIAALHAHYKNNYFLSLDIENFFGSVSLTRITRHLVPFFGYVAARNIAKDSTVKHPSEPQRTILPYGFVQSPMLASLALSKSALGNHLLTLTKSLTVSVYMDDIQVSGNNINDLEKAKEDLEHLATRSLFKFGEHKTQGPSPKITAFNINIETGNLEITDDRMAEFVFRLSNSPSEPERLGILGYINTVNPTQASSLIALGL